MAYYGESASYYGNGEQRPPYDRPYDSRPPYERPPYEEHRSSPYDRPPYEEYRGGPSYDSRPPYSSGPPSARPPQYPPPPLPTGWIQEWEPSARRAFFVETSTGRAEWTLPADVSYGGGDEHSRGVGSSSDYYAPVPVPAPSGYPPQEGGYPPQYPPQDGHVEQKEKKKDHGDTGKLLAAGAAGLAIGAVGGAILGHELTENSDHSSSSDEEEEEEAQYSDEDD